MSFRLRTVDRAADGREIVRERQIPASRITVGRDPGNTVHLPDLALEMQHLAIAQVAGGQLHLSALSGAGFMLDARNVSDATIDPAGGHEIMLGRYRLTFADGDGEPLITVSEGAAHQATDDVDAKSDFTLRRVLPSRRIVSWALIVFVLGLFLAWPIYNHLTRQPAPTARVAGDGSWTPGALSKAHHALENRCEACHVKPFESVRDSSCLSCHKQVHDHADPARLARARGEGSWFDQVQWRVAHAFGKPGPGGCVDCHTEHEGAGAMPAPQQQFCADCHQDMKHRLADTKLADAGDFGTAHPQFAPLTQVDRQSGTLRRVVLSDHPREASGLTFPHETHLSATGGVAKMAMRLGKSAGYGAPLDCASCHHRTEDGVRFKPVVMERDCQSCHSLAYDKVGQTYRTLRHGDIDQMMADLRASDRAAAPLVSNRQRPGDYASGRTYYVNFNAPRAGIGSIAGALGRDGVCGECHTANLSSAKPGVLPVLQPQRRMLKGWFDHRAHNQEKCSTCHAAKTSKSADDLLLPTLKQCRDCHLGENASRAEVPSSCAMCHGYHPTPLAPRKRAITGSGSATNVPIG